MLPSLTRAVHYSHESFLMPTKIHLLRIEQLLKLLFVELLVGLPGKFANLVYRCLILIDIGVDAHMLS